MRVSLAVLALIFLAVGCSSTASSTKRGAPKAGSLEAIWRGPGQSVALIPGTSDYSPGTVRVSFLVVDPRGHVVSRPTARVWLARSLAARPVTTTLATLEPLGVPGESGGADATAIYVAHVRVATAGRYQLVARPVGGRERIAGVAELHVAQRSASPMGTDNNPSQGRNRWVREWHLPGEPWTFLVGRDGRIKAKFQGSVSVGELNDAIRRLLL